MSTFTEIKNNYLTYISENYRDDNGNVDLQYDPDISTFIEILNQIQEDDPDPYLTCLNKIIEHGIKIDNIEYLVFMIVNLTDLLDLNDIDKTDTDFGTALIDIRNGYQDDVFAALKEYNANKNAATLYNNLDLAVKKQETIPKSEQLPLSSVHEDFYYIDPYKKEYQDDYEDPISSSSVFSQPISGAFQTNYVENDENSNNRTTAKMGLDLKKIKDKRFGDNSRRITSRRNDAINKARNLGNENENNMQARNLGSDFMEMAGGNKTRSKRKAVSSGTNTKRRILQLKRRKTKRRN
jgi:hypothetical protein